jgi:biopolymer transport protein ExbD
MLDVVFIMLIFFIVVASFIKEAGIEVNRPDNNQSDPSDATSILVRIEADDQIWMENRRVDARAVRANIQRLLAADPEQAGERSRSRRAPRQIRSSTWLTPPARPVPVP